MFLATHLGSRVIWAIPHFFRSSKIENLTKFFKFSNIKKYFNPIHLNRTSYYYILSWTFCHQSCSNLNMFRILMFIDFFWKSIDMHENIFSEKIIKYFSRMNIFKINRHEYERFSHLKPTNFLRMLYLSHIYTMIYKPKISASRRKLKQFFQLCCAAE